MSDPKRDLENGEKYPYHDKPPKDWAERSALGILYNLSDRRGIGHELEGVSYDVRGEIVGVIAEIIKEAHRQAT